jgi:hypothetical protein
MWGGGGEVSYDESCDNDVEELSTIITVVVVDDHRVGYRVDHDFDYDFDYWYMT